MIPIPIRRRLIAAGTVVLALLLGYAGVVAGWLLPSLFVAMGVLVVAQRLGRVATESLLMGILFFGYIVGNRGFAHINIGGVFIGELLLAVCLFLLALHIPARREIPVRTDGMLWWICAISVLGCIRMFFDFRSYGMLAMRDFAAIYYCLFFFVAQPIARHAPSLRLLDRILLVSIAVLIPLVVLHRLAPDFIQTHLVLNGAPLIFFKGDQVAAFLGLGFFLFVFGFWRSGSVTCLFIGAASMLLMLHATNRAALLGFAVVTGIVCLAGHSRVLRLQFSVLLLGMAALFTYYSATGTRVVDTRIYSLFEHTVSIVDFSGSFDYKNPEASNSGENNRYRLVWWRAVLTQTLDEAPLTGLGFGADLATPFIDEYYGRDIDDFTVRSPHSILVTIAARMGLPGLLLYLLLICLLARETWRAIQLHRSGKSERELILRWCAVWSIFIPALFGVVLEGPMGAIIFWTFLGIAWERTRAERSMDNQPDEATLAVDTPSSLPLATERIISNRI